MVEINKDGSNYHQSPLEISSHLEQILGIENILAAMLLTVDKGVAWKLTKLSGIPTLEMDLVLSNPKYPLILRYTPPVLEGKGIKGVVMIHDPGASVEGLDDISLYGKISDFGSIKLTEVRLDENDLPVFLGYEEYPNGTHPFYIYFHENDVEDGIVPTYDIIDANDSEEFEKDLQYFESLPKIGMNSLKGTVIQDSEYLLRVIKMIVPEALTDSFS